ncbi:sulfotransferase [Altererythrobacter sp.]|uniref:sulfotransferase family protein n=1 Tax=Altererythrobacter sp. TaxID=1872480 RepID=UPI003D0A8BFE
MLGQTREAEQAEMAAISASAQISTLAAAARRMEAREFGEASRLAAEHLRKEPDDLAALTLSAEAAIALSLPHKAIPLLQDVLKRAPSFFRARVLMANALMLTDQLRDALRLLAPMAEHHSEDAELINLLSRVHTELGDHAAASKANAQLVGIAPRSADAQTNLGDALRFSGRKAEAIAAYREAIGKDPHHGRAWWSLADIDPKALSNNDITAIRAALAARSKEPEHAGNLHFALGIALDSCGEAAEAFEQFAAGNALRRAAQPYDAHELSAQVDRHLAASTKEALVPGFAPPGDLPTPIFVLGMPRAGSTLLERILGEHSQIEALGELSIVPHMVERLRQDAPEGQVEATIARIDPKSLAGMGQWYLTRARERMIGAAPFFIDKLHMNWRHLPLILRMLPQAKIIDIRRNAMDCCWSNYKTLFARGHPAASDLSDLGHFYRDYARQTDTLAARAPDRIQQLSYEALVEDVETQLRELFDGLSIPFEPQVLDFHQSTAPVATASSEQVRRPLNRDGMQVWRPYSQWLGPLREALGDLAA